MSWIGRTTFNWPLVYATVVTIGYLADFAFYAACVWLGANIYAANVAAFLFGATVNVLLLRRFLRARPRFPLLRDLILTFASNGLMFAFGMAVFAALVELVRMNHFIAKILSAVLTFLLNYVTRIRFFSRV